MTVIHRTTDSAKLTPLPISALVIATWNLLEEASNLPQPRYLTVSDTQRVGVQFPESRSGCRSVARWARRFGATLQSSPLQSQDGQQLSYVRAEFDYYGVAVEVYAMIPARTAHT
jgi:hypothetical protein